MSASNLHHGPLLLNGLSACKLRMQGSRDTYMENVFDLFYIVINYCIYGYIVNIDNFTYKKFFKSNMFLLSSTGTYNLLYLNSSFLQNKY